MPKHKRRRLSTAALLDLAYRRLQESRELLRDFQERKQALDDAYESRSWRREVALDPPRAVIESVERINP